jgi:hypothetical protein
MTHLLLLVPLLVGQAEVAADAPTEPAKPASPPVYLTINSNRKDLLLINKNTEQTVCTMPCNKVVPGGANDLYYLGGSGISPSSRFTLQDFTRAAKIDIRAGSRPAKILGIIFTSVSIPTLLGGGGQMAWYGVQQIPQVRDGMLNNGWGAFYNPTSTLVTAIIELAVGAALLTTGIILWTRNNTRMTVEQSEPPTDPAVDTLTPVRPEPLKEETPAKPEPAAEKTDQT